MAETAAAIRDQKYLFEPNGGLLADVQGLEDLYDELHRILAERFEKFFVKAEIPAPASFLTYLRDHADRFYSKESAPEVVRGKNPADIDITQGMDALMAESQRELSEIRLFIDEWTKAGHPLIIRHGQGSIV